jgi:hypothetical protein
MAFFYPMVSTISVKRYRIADAFSHGVFIYLEVMIACVSISRVFRSRMTLAFSVWRFFSRIICLTFFRAVYGTFPDIPDWLWCSFQRLFPDRANAAPSLWIARRAAPLRTPYSAAILPILHYSRRYFRVLYTACLRPSVLAVCRLFGAKHRIPLQNRYHFFKGIGFYPLRPERYAQLRLNFVGNCQNTIFDRKSKVLFWWLYLSHLSFSRSILKAFACLIIQYGRD